MCNKVKLEQPFSVAIAQRVAVFQTGLKLVREDAGG